MSIDHGWDVLCSCSIELEAVYGLRRVESTSGGMYSAVAMPTPPMSVHLKLLPKSIRDTFLKIVRCYSSSVVDTSMRTFSGFISAWTTFSLLNKSSASRRLFSNYCSRLLELVEQSFSCKSFKSIR